MYFTNFMTVALSVGVSRASIVVSLGFVVYGLYDHSARQNVTDDGFIDPFGHLWLVGDRSPLSAHPGPW
jgi:hypothetical protein